MKLSSVKSYLEQTTSVTLLFHFINPITAPGLTEVSAWTDIDTNSFVNRTIKLWNLQRRQRLSPVEHMFSKKRVRKVIRGEVKWRDLKRGDKTSKSGGKWKMVSEVKWFEAGDKTSKSGGK